MLPIEFKPSLSECIVTLAKRAYEESLRDCLAPAGYSKELQEKVKLRWLFLESADF